MAHRGEAVQLDWRVHLGVYVARKARHTRCQMTLIAGTTMLCGFREGQASYAVALCKLM
jgi:hypothetical protein